MNSTISRNSRKLRGAGVGDRREPAPRYLVTGRGFAESMYPTFEQAVARARAMGPAALVVCVEQSRETETRQTVWPTVGAPSHW